MQTESVTPTTTKPKAGKPKTNEERLAPLTAAVATATRERDELAQLVERDRARLAK
ncbi:MAG: hypothetical protein HYV09_15195, partial [Deltaproteobacteria bacterium]|nr:hypothetical protein [Deltaproteobacteria bacterium]